jgi:sulfur carrier protein ThiS
MKVWVKLYGNLREQFPGYRHSQGMEVELPEGATVKDLLATLDMSARRGVVVIVEGRVLDVGDGIRSGIPVSVFQTIQGG